MLVSHSLLRPGVLWFDSLALRPELRRRAALALGASALLGCVGDRVSDAGIPNMGVTPRLERQLKWTSPSEELLGTSISIAVSDSGTIGMLEPDRPSDPVLVLVDAETGLTRRLIRRGQGPEELSGAGLITAARNAFEVLDLARQETITISPEGEIRKRSPLPILADLVVGTTADSVDLVGFSSSSTGGIRRRARSGGKERVVVAPSDSFFQNMIANYTTGSGMLGRRFGYAASSRGVLIADGYSNSLAVYDNGGRPIWTSTATLEPRRRTEAELLRIEEGMIAEGLSAGERNRILERAREEILPHFEGEGVWLDDSLVAWIVRPAGDSVAVEHFANGTSLGRVMLPCRNPGRRIGFSMNWLVFLCEAPIVKDTDSGVELQVYRVTR